MDWCELVSVVWFCRSSGLSKAPGEAAFEGSHHEEPCRWVSAASGTMVTRQLTPMINDIPPRGAEPRCTLNAAFYHHRSADCLSVEWPNQQSLLISSSCLLLHHHHRWFCGLTSVSHSFTFWLSCKFCCPAYIFFYQPFVIDRKLRSWCCWSKFYHRMDQNLINPTSRSNTAVSSFKYTQYCMLQVSFFLS